MHRREFLSYSAGTLGAIVPAMSSNWSAFGAVFAEEDARGSSASSASSADSELAKACAALEPGDGADFPAGAQSAFSEADLAWQSTFHNDDQHGLIHLMGKPANANRSWHHQYYTVADNEWTVVARGMWNNPGHIYGAFTIDHGTGDLFQWRGNMNGRGPTDRRASWWKHETKEWDFIPVDVFDGALESHPNGSTWHPNLYGAGDGGLILQSGSRTLFWRNKDDAVESVSHRGLSFGAAAGIGAYWPAKDVAFVGGGQGGRLLKVTPDGSRTPKVEPVGELPITLGGNSHIYSTRFGSLHVHPGNPDKPLIVETVGEQTRTSGSRAWTSEDGSDWGRIEDHTFTTVPRVVCSLRGGLGALWAIGKTGSRDVSQLWKPKA